MRRNLNIKSFVPTLFSLVLSVSLLTACSEDDDGFTSPHQAKGYFLDSPVINIGYRAQITSGVFASLITSATDDVGGYTFNIDPGQSQGRDVTFFIGDLEFPTVPANRVITPLELAGTQDVSDPTVVNMLRLLQTLDKDGNLDNGITITDIAKQNATAVDFSLSEVEFEASSAVVNLINNAGLDSPIGLVSKANAMAHFEAQLATIPSLDFSIRELENVTHFTVFNSGTDGDCPIPDHAYVESIFFDAGGGFHFKCL